MVSGGLRAGRSDRGAGRSDEGADRSDRGAGRGDEGAGRSADRSNRGAGRGDEGAGRSAGWSGRGAGRGDEGAGRGGRSGGRGPAFWAGATITGGYLAIALIACVWTPRDPTAIDIADKLEGPSLHHWFGTDQLGRDVLSMIMAGARNTVGVALLSVLIGAAVGIPLGLTAAAERGIGEELIMRGNDLIFAFPALLLAILITAALGPGAVNAVIAIGVFNIPVFARVVRGGSLNLWTRDYTLAARVAGKGRARISLEHILPNLATLLVVQGTIQFSLGVIAEAGLSYVGLGAQPPTPSWGRMLNEAQSLTAIDPALALFPGGAVVLLVLGLNLLGDGLGRRRGV